MGFFRRAFQAATGGPTDPFYAEVLSANRYPAHQAAFLEILSLLGAWDFENYVTGGKRDPERYASDDRKLNAYFDKALGQGLSVLALQVMLYQYAMADVYFRDRHKENWVAMVCRRKSIDFFPDSAAIITKFFEIPE